MDRFKAELECPKCHATGVVQLSQEDGWSFVKGNRQTTVESLPEGFEIVRQPSNICELDFYCARCKVSAVK